MSNFTNFPPANLPLTGNELAMIAQYQAGGLVTCTAPVSEFGGGGGGGPIIPTIFEIAISAWLATLPTSSPSSAIWWNNGGIPTYS